MIIIVIKIPIKQVRSRNSPCREDQIPSEEVTDTLIVEKRLLYFGSTDETGDKNDRGVTQRKINPVITK